ncbi:MAG: hypothetical protein CMO55_16410 [Verrucomicrobiales bacterium]|nr:hypothetical protein [Verrucomicrobiales bacterium]
MKLSKSTGRAILTVLICILSPEVSTAAPWQVDCRQVVLVVTSDWSATEGTLRTFQRARDKWVEVGKGFPVNVGRNGLGWGLGLHRKRKEEPSKREGDRRAPAGVFRLGGGFGAKGMSLSQFPYRTVDDGDLWIDDPDSRSYNRWVRKSDPNIVPDWNSSEILKRRDGLYDHAIVVEHNMNPIVPGRGSAIFMHIWLGRGVPTIGCTTMEKDKIRSLLKWLDASARPVLVQVPRSELEGLELPQGLKQAVQ